VAGLTHSPTSGRGYADPLGLFTLIDAISAWNHYCDGGPPTSWTTSFESINWGDARSRINARIKKLVGGTCVNATLPVDFIQSAQTGGVDAEVIGRHNLRVRGQINLKCDCTWSFGGMMESATGVDPYNFNPSDRSLFGEVSAWIGRHRCPDTGRTFNIYIIGSEGLSLGGKIPGTPTCPGC
jgi:hypothetical protein